MSIERLTAQVAALSDIVNGLVGGQSNHSHSYGPSADDFEEIQKQLSDLTVQMKVVQSEAKSTARVAAAQASQAARSSMLGAIQGAVEPVVQLVVDHERATVKQVQAGIASVSNDITAAKAVAGQSATTSRDLLLATVNQFSRG